MGYPNDLLATRAVIKPGLFAVIPKAGLVNNVIPQIKNCRVSIVASPKMGAGFAQYVIEAQPGGGTSEPFGGENDIESFLYCMEGQFEVNAGGKSFMLTGGGYAYTPPGMGIGFLNRGPEPGRLLFYKQRYTPCKEGQPYLYTGNVNLMEYRIYDNMSNVFIKDLLPGDMGFDMNMHILSFSPGGCHPFAETHVQEHGAYVLEGEGMYMLDDRWMGIKKDDFIWFGPYVPQCAYGVGTRPFTYIYSKDCNRDAAL